MSLITESLYFTGPYQLEVREETLPDPKPGEVVIEATVSGISAGTELNVYRGLAPQWKQRMDPATRLFTSEAGSDWKWPARYGYAMVGRISAIGDRVSVYSPGDLVFAYAPHGRHAIVNHENIIPLPEMQDEEIGVFLPNFNTAYNGVLDANVPLGGDVVVMGLGVVGQLVVKLLKRGGARIIVGVDHLALRRDFALRGGAHHTLQPSDDVAGMVRGLTDGRGADVVIEVSGTAAGLNEAIRTAGFNGVVVALSWYGGTFEQLSLSGEFHHNRPRIIASQVGSLSPFLGPLWSLRRRAAIVGEYLSIYENDLRALITHRIPLREAIRCYRLIDQGATDLMQVLLDYRLNAGRSLKGSEG
jgi:2-desacetyl-2-hydroxyethyl bacteriochlorophyllide A dehydrogenase